MESSAHGIAGYCMVAVLTVFDTCGFRLFLFDNTSDFGEKAYEEGRHEQTRHGS
jgi:hypothetical protein